MRKSKTKLIFTLAVALLSVLTMGVSTYAWFQAQAAVNIETSSDDCEITVTKPDDVTGSYFVYRGNTSYGYQTKGAITAFDEHNGDTLPAITNFKPGYKASYMIKVKGKTSFTLTLSSFTPGTSANRKLLKADGTDSGKFIAAAYGINIYSKAYTEQSDSTYLTWVESTAEYSDANSVIYDKFKYDGVITSAPINNEATAADTSTWSYIYFTVAFDQHQASLYDEYTGISGSIQGYDGDDGSTRYFKQSNTGNSNCFMGLAFGMTSISISQHYEKA